MEGGIVPVKITLDLLKESIMTKQCSRFLIDGFPETLTIWMVGWEQHGHSLRCRGVHFFWLSWIRVESDCWTVARPVVGIHNLESARKRFRTYQESTIPIIEYYRDKGMLLEVSGDQSGKCFGTSIRKSSPSSPAKWSISRVSRWQEHTGNWALYASTWSGYDELWDPEYDEENEKGVQRAGLAFADWFA